MLFINNEIFCYNERKEITTEVMTSSKNLFVLGIWPRKLTLPIIIVITAEKRGEKGIAMQKFVLISAISNE